jgi:hypothetical protein
MQCKEGKKDGALRDSCLKRNWDGFDILDFEATGTIREKGVNELDEFAIDWYNHEFFNQPVVPHLIEDPLYVEKNSKSAHLQIGMPGGIRVKLNDRADSEAFGPESKFLRRKEVVGFKEVFHAVRENFLKNLGGCDGSYIQMFQIH